MFRIPLFLWSRMVRAEAAKSAGRLGFMTAEHHAVRDLVVSEIRADRPVSVERISAGTGLSSQRVAEVVGELERNLTFLFRSEGSDVDWAYPATARATPHRIRLDSGERLFGA